MDGVTKTPASILANPPPDGLPGTNTPKHTGHIFRARLFDDQQVIDLDDVLVQAAEEPLLSDQQTGDLVPVVGLEPRRVELDHAAYAAVDGKNRVLQIVQPLTAAQKTQVKVVKPKAGVLPIPPARQLQLADDGPRFEPEARAGRHGNGSICIGPQELGVGER